MPSYTLLKRSHTYKWVKRSNTHYWNALTHTTEMLIYTTERLLYTLLKRSHTHYWNAVIHTTETRSNVVGKDVWKSDEIRWQQQRKETKTVVKSDTFQQPAYIHIYIYICICITSSGCFSRIFLCIFYHRKFEFQVVLFILLLHLSHGDHQCDIDWQKANTTREKGEEEKPAVSVVTSSSWITNK